METCEAGAAAWTFILGVLVAVASLAGPATAWARVLPESPASFRRAAEQTTWHFDRKSAFLAARAPRKYALEVRARYPEPHSPLLLGEGAASSAVAGALMSAQNTKRLVERCGQENFRGSPTRCKSSLRSKSRDDAALPSTFRSDIDVDKIGILRLTLAWKYNEGVHLKKKKQTSWYTRFKSDTSDVNLGTLLLSE